MPIHLAPISRRRFLQGAAVAGAGLALTPDLLAATKQVDDNAWALLSDTHLAANRSLLFRGINMVEHFKVVSNELLGLTKRPAGIMVTGDCAYNQGESGDYTLLSELLDPIRQSQMPVHLALGNHDHREHFWAAFQDQRSDQRPVIDRQVALLQTPRVNWFILDSLDKTLSTPGLLGHEQLDWLAKSLDEYQQKPAIVIVHHNPGLNGGNMGLKDTLSFLEIIRPRTQVKAYIYGHTHHWQVEQDPSGIHFVNLPPVAYVFHDGDPSGWVQATMKIDGMRLELRCIDPSHKAHGEIHDLKWRA
jgi:3',5'-cyclic AMP phosphodiesterase CpdA